MQVEVVMIEVWACTPATGWGVTWRMRGCLLVWRGKKVEKEEGGDNFLESSWYFVDITSLHTPEFWKLRSTRCKLLTLRLQVGYCKVASTCDAYPDDAKFDL